MVDGHNMDQHVSAQITVSLVHEDGTTHGVCSLSASDDDQLFYRLTNMTKRVTSPDMTVE